MNLWSIITFIVIEIILIGNVLASSPIPINIWCPIGAAMGFIGVFYMNYRRQNSKN